MSRMAKVCAAEIDPAVYSAGPPSRWALAHIYTFVFISVRYV